MEETKTTSLYYREGSSDKEYHVRLEAKDHGFVVNIAYGRRGSTLSTGTKTHSPVYYDAALLIFERLVREKRAKGYTTGSAGTPYQHTEQAAQVSGLLPQLLNPIEEAEVLQLIADPRWAMQEKMDGKRLLLRKEGHRIEGINKKGLLVGVPETVTKTAAQLSGDFVLDGECIGDHLHAFDLLFLNGEDLRAKSYHHRYVLLLNLLASGLPKHIRIVGCFIDPLDKASWLHTFKRQKAEGIVFKQLSAPYTPGTAQQRRLPTEAQVRRHLVRSRRHGEHAAERPTPPPQSRRLADRRQRLYSGQSEHPWRRCHRRGSLSLRLS